MNELLREELTQTVTNLVDIIGRMQAENLREAIAEFKPEPQDNDTFTPAEAAEYLRCETTTIYRKVNSGEIASFRLGRKIFIHKHVLDEWMAEGGSAAL